METVAPAADVVVEAEAFGAVRLFGTFDAATERWFFSRGDAPVRATETRGASAAVSATHAQNTRFIPASHLARETRRATSHTMPQCCPFT